MLCFGFRLSFYLVGAWCFLFGGGWVLFFSLGGFWGGIFDVFVCLVRVSGLVVLVCLFDWCWVGFFVCGFGFFFWFFGCRGCLGYLLCQVLWFGFGVLVWFGLFGLGFLVEFLVVVVEGGLWLCWFFACGWLVFFFLVVFVFGDLVACGFVFFVGACRVCFCVRRDLCFVWGFGGWFWGLLFWVLLIGVGVGLVGLFFWLYLGLLFLVVLWFCFGVLFLVVAVGFVGGFGCVVVFGGCGLLGCCFCDDLHIHYRFFVWGVARDNDTHAQLIKKGVPFFGCYRSLKYRKSVRVSVV